MITLTTATIYWLLYFNFNHTIHIYKNISFLSPQICCGVYTPMNRDSFIYLGGILGFDLRVSCFLGRCFTTWAMPAVPFACFLFVYYLFVVCLFEIRSYIYAEASLYCDPSFHASHIAGWRVCSMGFYWLPYDLMNLLPRLASNRDSLNLCLLSS